jgi:transposase
VGQHQAHAEPQERVAFSSYLYRYRNLVERFFNKIKHYGAITTRYDKQSENFLAGVTLASLRLWMRFNGSRT